VAEDRRPARIRRQQRSQNAHQRGLARPVRAQQAKHHPRRDLEPGTIERHRRPEALDHTLDPHRRPGRSKSVHSSTIEATEGQRGSAAAQLPPMDLHGALLASLFARSNAC